MGIMDKFKNFIGIPEDEYYDDDDVEFIRNESPRAEAFNNETAPIHSEGKRGNRDTCILPYITIDSNIVAGQKSANYNIL